MKKKKKGNAVFGEKYFLIILAVGSKRKVN
jgi:hypothetical protein